MKVHFPLAVLVLLMSCQSQSKKDGTSDESIDMPKTNHYTTSISNVLEAHGGIETWHSMKQLSFDKGIEHHQIELKSRKVRVASPSWSMGSDGNDVWISPAENDYKGDPRFYHSLYFYFFSMPFVLGDPGVIYEDVEDRELLGETYKGIKISFGTGVGDSPKDNYVLYYHPETNEMAWLMYTVTFRTQETSDRFNLIKYSDWEEFDGVKLPTKLVWYNHKDGVVGEPRNEVLFTNIQITKDIPDASLFQMPTDAKVVPKPTEGAE